jgi:hypothetical protein
VSTTAASIRYKFRGNSGALSVRFRELSLLAFAKHQPFCGPTYSVCGALLRSRQHDGLLDQHAYLYLYSWRRLNYIGFQRDPDELEVSFIFSRPTPSENAITRRRARSPRYNPTHYLEFSNLRVLVPSYGPVNWLVPISRLLLSSGT